MLGEQLLE
jgi:hypothetical protein